MFDNISFEVQLVIVGSIASLITGVMLALFQHNLNQHQERKKRREEQKKADLEKKQAAIQGLIKTATAREIYEIERKIYKEIQPMQGCVFQWSMCLTPILACSIILLALLQRVKDINPFILYLLWFVVVIVLFIMFLNWAMPIIRKGYRQKRK